MYHYGDFGPSARPKDIDISKFDDGAVMPQVNPIRRPLSYSPAVYGSLNLHSNGDATAVEKSSALIAHDHPVIVSASEKKRLQALWNETLSSPAPRIAPQHAFSTEKADVVEAFRHHEKRRKPLDRRTSLPSEAESSHVKPVNAKLCHIIANGSTTPSIETSSEKVVAATVIMVGDENDSVYVRRGSS